MERSRARFRVVDFREHDFVWISGSTCGLFASVEPTSSRGAVNFQIHCGDAFMIRPRSF